MEYPAHNSVTSAKIVDGEVKTADLGSGAVTLVVHERFSDYKFVTPGGNGEIHADV